VTSIRKWLVGGLLALPVAMATLWGAMALWYTLPGSETLRTGMALAFALFGAASLAVALYRQKFVTSLVPLTFVLAATIAWMTSMQPSNDRQWQPDVAALPHAEIDGDIVTVRNIRSFEYHQDGRQSPRWVDKTFDLRKLDRLDLIAVHWMGDDIAHIMLSFGFGDDQIAVSIEVRKEKGESYSAWAGFFRQYELYYVFADEADVIGLRTTYRKPPEDVYLFAIDADRENIRKLFLEYVGKANKLRSRPEFYNTIITNCTTNIVMHIRAFQKNVPFDWRILASGYFPELFYEAGAMDQSMSYRDLRNASLVNERAHAADGAPDFSRQIRAGLPGRATDKN